MIAKHSIWDTIQEIFHGKIMFYFWDIQFLDCWLCRKVLRIQVCQSIHVPVCNAAISIFACLSYFLHEVRVQLTLTKSDEALFSEVLDLPKMGVNGAFLGLKLTFLIISLNLFIRFFWNRTWGQAKIKVTVFNF